MKIEGPFATIFVRGCLSQCMYYFFEETKYFFVSLFVMDLKIKLIYVIVQRHFSSSKVFQQWIVIAREGWCGPAFFSRGSSRISMSFFSPPPLFALGLLPATVWQVIIQCFVKVKVKDCCNNHKSYSSPLFAFDFYWPLAGHCTYMCTEKESKS